MWSRSFSRRWGIRPTGPNPNGASRYQSWCDTNTGETGRSEAWFLYLLRCADGTLYTGVTTDLARRVAEHNGGRGARYTAGRRPVTLLAAWRFPDRGAAQRAEYRFRHLRRERKLALAAQELPFMKAPCLLDTRL